MSLRYSMIAFIKANLNASINERRKINDNVYSNSNGYVGRLRY